jgi:dihydroflavonol-4-reductase
LRVLVTGAAGFVGSAVVRRLLERKHRVLAYLEPGASDANLEGIDVDRIEGDICDAVALRRAMEGCEGLVHLAAIYQVWMKDPSVLWRVNIEGTTAVLLAASRAGVRRIVHTSSIAAVGVRPDGEPSDETDAFNHFKIANDYLLTKYASERIALRFAEAGAPIVVVNPGFVFGERDRGPTPTGRILVTLLQRKVPFVGPGGYNVVDVEDVAAGHVAALDRGRVGERYILGGHNVTYEEFFARAALVAGVPRPRRKVPSWMVEGLGLVSEAISDHVTHRHPLAPHKAMQYASLTTFFDSSKARRELEMPCTPLEETIEKAVRWFRENGYVK